VLTFGSTVGIEAVFWGTPSIHAGVSYYHHLGGTYNASSHEDVIALLKADLPPKDRTAAFVYGYYLNTYGIPFKYFQATGVGAGRFKGQAIFVRQSNLALLKGRAKAVLRLLASEPVSKWPGRMMELWVGRLQRSRSQQIVFRLIGNLSILERLIFCFRQSRR
jgi:hypothetical protein